VRFLYPVTTPVIERTYVGAGMMLYDVFARTGGRPPGVPWHRHVGRRQLQREAPGLRPNIFRGGLSYSDAQVDDARLVAMLARTAASYGAHVANRVRVEGFLKVGERVVGVTARDLMTDETFEIRAKQVVNATGVWVDQVRQMDGSATGRTTEPMVAPSQGVHLVVDRSFLPGDHALLVPKTHDGRVLFAVPWLGKVILGTTDTARPDLAREPEAFAAEVEFILGEAAKYLSRAPTRADVKSIWVGLRPLVRPPSNELAASTKQLSREHTVLVSPSGLVTVTGGKWTTYRAMAEDVLDKCVESSLLGRLPPSETNDFLLVGASANGGTRPSMAEPPGMDAYGNEADWLRSLPGNDVELAPGLSGAMVRFAARHEYARTVEDVLARRSRLLFLDARLAAETAPGVASIIQEETGRDPCLAQFLDLAERYLHVPG